MCLGGEEVFLVDFVDFVFGFVVVVEDVVFVCVVFMY